MPQIQSPLTTGGPSVPLVNATELGKAAGLFMVFANLAALNTAIGTDSPPTGERGNIVAGSGMWQDGQPLDVAAEPQMCWRRWFVGASAALSNARRVVLPSGNIITLPTDTSAVLSTVGAPSGGNNGDMAIDFAGNAYYVKGTISAGVVTAGGTWSAAIGIFPQGTINVTGVPGWAASTAYVAGQRVIDPSGRLAVAFANHTSSTTFNATNWVYPSDDGGSFIDFTQLPDGDITTVVPTKGRVSSFGNPTNAAGYQVIGGLLQCTTDTNNIYFELSLPNPALKVQHYWVVMDVPATLAANDTTTFVWSRDDIGSGIAAPIHSGFNFNPSGSGTGLWGSEAYGIAGLRSVIQYVPPVSLAGRTVRIDMTYDLISGLLTGYVDGALAFQFVDSAIATHVRGKANLQFARTAGATAPNRFKIRHFGISPIFPEWAKSGAAKVDWATFNGYSFPGLTTLSSTWQKWNDFYVMYDAQGKMLIEWNPYITCTSGQVWLAVAKEDATLGAAEIAAAYYPQLVIGGAMSVRVPFRWVRQGTPFTVERLAIWARTTGAASIENNQTCGFYPGITWRAIQNNGVTA